MVHRVLLPDIGRIIAVVQKYHVEMDFSTLMDISQKYNVWHGGPPAVQAAQAQEQFVGEPL